MREAEAPDVREQISALPDGWIRAMGVHLARATAVEVVATLDIGPVHRQPLGIVHGGVYAGLVETVASVGANVALLDSGRYAVGMENHTSFLRAVREGSLRAVARPVAQGRQSALWQVEITDSQGHLAASGRVRFLVIAEGAPLAGEGAGLVPQA